MPENNYHVAVLGSGIAGLIVFYCAKSESKVLITNNLENQLTKGFPLGPRFLHIHEATEKLLSQLGLSTAIKTVYIGYKKDDVISETPFDDFINVYAEKSRGTKKIENSFLSGYKSFFRAYETTQTELGKVLMDRCKESIVVGEIQSIENNIIVMNDRSYRAKNIVSTIPLLALTKILNLNIKCKLGEVCFYLVDEKGKDQFDYIYSISDPWYRKTHVPELDKWVYEVRKSDQREFERKFKYENKTVIASQIINSSTFIELRGIKLVGRYAQMNHSVKTEDIVKWAFNEQNFR